MLNNLLNSFGSSFVSVPINLGAEHRVMRLRHRETIIPGWGRWHLNGRLAPLLHFFCVFLESHESVSAVTEDGNNRKGEAQSGSDGRSREPSRLSENEAIHPRSAGHAANIEVVASAEGLDAVINRRVWLHNWKFGHRAETPRWYSVVGIDQSQ